MLRPCLILITCLASHCERPSAGSVSRCISVSAGIYAPICLKKAVDALGGLVNQAAVHRTVQALLLSGLCRVANTLAKEAQGPIFTPIAQVLSSPSCIVLQADVFECRNAPGTIVEELSWAAGRLVML